MISWSQATPVGTMSVVVGGAGIVGLSLPSDRAAVPLGAHPERDDAIAAELDEYFAGTRHAFTVPIDLSAVDGFARRVLETLHAEVPWGETVAYGELADMVGAPRAARAVGNVMATSPISIVVPCHRVIAAGGRIGGYGGFADRSRRSPKLARATNGVGGYGGSPALRRALLAIEGIHLP